MMTSRATKKTASTYILKYPRLASVPAKKATIGPSIIASGTSIKYRYSMMSATTWLESIRASIYSPYGVFYVPLPPGNQRGGIQRRVRPLGSGFCGERRDKFFCDSVCHAQRQQLGHRYHPLQHTHLRCRRHHDGRDPHAYRCHYPAPY